MRETFNLCSEVTELDCGGLDEGYLSDETKINRFGSYGKQWVWKEAEQGLINREVQKTVKFDGGNIMVWKCMG